MYSNSKSESFTDFCKFIFYSVGIMPLTFPGIFRAARPHGYVINRQRRACDDECSTDAECTETGVKCILAEKENCYAYHCVTPEIYA